jgi:hypothetical protein
MVLVGRMEECLRHCPHLYIVAGGGKHVPARETAVKAAGKSPGTVGTSWKKPDVSAPMVTKKS